MNLFALTDIPEFRVLRLPLTQDLQQEVVTLFRAQERAFMSDIDQEVTFDGRCRPEPGELLVIRDFVDVDGLQEAIRSPLEADQFNPQTHDLARIKALFSGYDRDGDVTVLVQLFEPRRVIARKGLAIFFTSAGTFTKGSDAGLTLDHRLLAVLKGVELRFQSFHYLRRVFEMEDYFEAATDQDVLSFARHPKIAVANDNEFLAIANRVVRSKITLIQQSGILDNHTCAEIAAAAEGFNINIQVDGNQCIVLPNDRRELRRILRFLDEDYYESPVSQTKFISNSKRVAD